MTKQSELPTYLTIRQMRKRWTYQQDVDNFYGKPEPNGCYIQSKIEEIERSPEFIKYKEKQRTELLAARARRQGGRRLR